MAETEDYSEEVTPTAHHESHEKDGDDEISLALLVVDPADIALDTTNFDGILSAADDDPQKALDTLDDHGHAQLHTQNTDTMLDEGGTYPLEVYYIHDAVGKRHDRNRDTYLDHGGGTEISSEEACDTRDAAHAQLHATQHVTGGGDVVANAVAAGNSGLMTGADKTKLDTEMGIHEALPTVHQDAPDLILTHKGDASAHHAKYTDAAARAAIYGTKPCFSAHLTNTVLNVTGDGTSYDITGEIWTELVDQGSNFSNGIFTAPDTGIYLFNGCIALDGILAAHTYGYALLTTNNRQYIPFNANPSAIAGVNVLYMPFSFYADMNADHTAYLSVRIFYGGKVIDLTTFTYFGGSRII